MNPHFLIRPVQLNQAFEHEKATGGGGNDVTRRTFIKRTGGATVAAMVTWNLATLEARAEEGGSGSNFSV
ncbi:MAG TPA: twin-arginine translocation signal domain-containing protein, partial [Luteolibacter sp.]